MRPDFLTRRAAPPERAVTRWWRNVSQGRMQKTLAAATAFSALPLGLEIYFEHFRGSFVWVRDRAVETARDGLPGFVTALLGLTGDPDAG